MGGIGRVGASNQDSLAIVASVKPLGNNRHGSKDIGTIQLFKSVDRQSRFVFRNSGKFEFF